MVVDLTSGDERDLAVEKIHDRPKEAGLRLTALAEQDQVVAGQDPAFERGQHRLVEADDAREQLITMFQLAKQVRAELFLDGAVGVAGGAKLADRGGAGGVHADQGSERLRKR